MSLPTGAHFDVVVVGTWLLDPWQSVGLDTWKCREVAFPSIER